MYPRDTSIERRRVSGRSIEFGLTQRPFQRLDGGQDLIPGRHGAGEDGHSALDSIITPPGPEINPEFPPGIPPGSAIASVSVNGHRRPIR